jgi:hypothetical protein
MPPDWGEQTNLSTPRIRGRSRATTQHRCPRSIIITDLIRRGALALAVTGLLLTSGASTAMAASGPLAIGTDGFARFDVTPESGATQVWIEVEEPSITPADVVIRLNGTSQTVTATALGVISIAPASSSTQSFAVALTLGATPDIAVTIIDGTGAILSSTSYQPTLVDYRTLPQAAIPSGPAGWLAATGINLAFTIILAAIAALAVAIGAAMKKRATRAVSA